MLNENKKNNIIFYMKTNLNGEWIINSPKYQNIKAKMPGSVLSALLENNLIEDPYYRMNEYETKKISFEDFDFERDFDLSKEQLKQDNFLCFDGIDTIADIYINDEFIFRNKDMHLPQKILLAKEILREHNHIRIHFTSPYQYVWNYKNKEFFGPEQEAAYFVEPKTSVIRKSNCMFGWDWGPNLGDMGIYRDIYILSTTLGHFEQFRHKVTFLDNGQVQVDLTTKYRKVGNGKITAKLSLKGQILSEITQEFDKENHFSFIIDKPLLWWPNGFGEQNLYDLDFVISNDKEEQTTHKRIGIRKIRIDDSNDEYGRNLAIYVNDVHVFLKGSDYIPQDVILQRVTPERTRRLLTLVKDFNHNVIRVWGGGYYPDDDFYDTCDEFGILIFQDLMFACFTYDSDDTDYRLLVNEEVRSNLRRIRHHASLMLLSGNNEIEEQVVNRTDVYKEKYKKLFLEYLPKIVKEELDIYYLTSSPTSGEPYLEKPSDNNYLDAHNWAVWHGLQPFEYFHTIYPRLLSEYGCQSIPTYDTVMKYTIEEDWDLESPVMDCHQKNKSCNYKIIHYAKSLYREPTNFKDLIYLSQLSQAEGIKMCAEHLRRNKERCNGTLYWQLNDDWPGQSWSSIDYYFGIKALHYYSRRFYAPHLISVEAKDNKILIAVSNDTKENKEYEVHYSLRDFNGHILNEKIVNCKVDKTSYAYALELDDPFDRDDLVIYVELRDKKGHFLSNNFYQKLKDMDLHYQVPHLKVTRIDDKSFSIETDYYTKDIYIEPHDNNCVLSDNYFNLLPKQKVIISSTHPLDYEKMEIRFLNDICK